MKSQALSLAFVFVASAVLCTANADDKISSTNTARFEALKKLAGDWVAQDKDGKPTSQIVSSFRVTAAGSAVEETIFPGTDHEMVTVYHRDGDDLMLTHYCMLGNQPRMKAQPSSDTKEIVFVFCGATNLKKESENHMHQATFKLVDKDHFEAQWESQENGAPCHKVNFSLVRKAK
jgi:hypothetical protein